MSQDKLIIEIDGDVNPLEKDLQKVDKISQDTGKKLADNINKGFDSVSKLDPKSLGIDELEKSFQSVGIEISKQSPLVQELSKQMQSLEKENAFKRLKEDTGASSLQMARLRQSMGDTKGALRSLAPIASGLAVSLAAVGVAIVAIGTASLDAILQVDRLNKAYSTIMGSATASTQQLERIRLVSQNLGLEFYSVAEGAKGFFASSVGTTLEADMNGIFEGVSSAGAALALTEEQVQGVFFAISQMASKGRVSMEEVHQVGERLPGTFNLIAKSLNLSKVEVFELIESGELMATDLLPKLGRAMQEEFGDKAKESAQGAQAAVNRLSTAWTDFKANIVNSEVMITAINGITSALQTLGEWADLRSISETNKEAIELAQKGQLSLKGFWEKNAFERQRLVDEAKNYEINSEKERLARLTAYERQVQEQKEKTAKAEAEAQEKLFKATSEYTKNLPENKIAVEVTKYDEMISGLDAELAKVEKDTEEYNFLLKKREQVVQAHQVAMDGLNKKASALSWSEKSFQKAYEKETTQLEQLQEEINEAQMTADGFDLWKIQNEAEKLRVEFPKLTEKINEWEEAQLKAKQVDITKDLREVTEEIADLKKIDKDMTELQFNNRIEEMQKELPSLLQKTSELKKDLANVDALVADPSTVNINATTVDVKDSKDTPPEQPVQPTTGTIDYEVDVKAETEKIIQDVKDTWSKSSKSISDAISSSLSQSLKGALNGTYESTSDLLKSIGQNLMVSLADSMLDNVMDVVEPALDAIGDFIISTMKSILKINSPSKVFVGFGKSNMEGLALGMSDNMKMITSPMEEIKKVSQDMMGFDYKSAIDYMSPSFASNTSLTAMGSFGQVVLQPQVYIQNYGNDEVSTSTSTDNQGNMRLDVMIGKAATTRQTTPGTPENRTLRTSLGLSNQPIRR